MKKIKDYAFVFDQDHSPFWLEKQKQWLAKQGGGKYISLVNKLPINQELRDELNLLLNIDDHWQSYVDFRETNPEAIKRYIERLRKLLGDYREHAKAYPKSRQLLEMENGLEKPWESTSKKDAEVIYCTDRHIFVRIKSSDGFFKAAHETYGTDMGLCTAAHNKDLRDMWHLYYSAKLESFDAFFFDREGGFDSKTFIQQHIFKNKTIRWNRKDEPTSITGKANEWLKKQHNCDFDLEGYLKKEQARMARIRRSEKYKPLKERRLQKFEYLSAKLRKEGAIGSYSFI